MYVCMYARDLMMHGLGYILFNKTQNGYEYYVCI